MVKTILKGQIISQIPGRARLNYPGLKYLKGSYSAIATQIKALPDIKGFSLNAISQNIIIEHKYNSVQHLIEALNYIFEPYAIDVYIALKEKQELKTSPKAVDPSSHTILKRLIISGLTIGLGNTVFKNAALKGLGNNSYLNKLTTVPSLVALGLTSPLFKSAAAGIKEDKILNADFLTITSIVASILLGQSYSALTIVMLSDIAEFMTQHTIERTRNSVKNLLSMDEKYVWKLLENGELKHFPIEKINIDDQVVIHTGEKIAVDGLIVAGQALVDQSSTTGEFMPALCKAGDKVLAGSLIKSGVITVKAEKVGDDTVVSRIINMIENIDAKKAPLQHYADQFSNYLVPLNFMAAIAVFLITRRTEQALKMLIIDYSCGIKLSTATAFSAAINSAVKRGILIKGGASLEMLSRANTLILDKTGTITEGKPQVSMVKIIEDSFSEPQIIALAAAAEETSSHPLAAAILDYAIRLGIKIPRHEQVETIVSKGSLTVVDGKTVRVGSYDFMTENGIMLPDIAMLDAKAGMDIYVALDQKLLAIIYIIDQPRANIRRAINNLRQKGIDQITLLTGDRKEQAQIIADMIGVDAYNAELLPENKAATVLKMQAEGNQVVMVGDGINDAPALSYADVGISLGSKSTDVAMETSDIIISPNDPMLIPRVRELADYTMAIVKQNFGMVIIINSLGLLWGAAGNISVFWSAVIHNMSTIAVVANSCRLLINKKEDRP